MPGGYGQTQRKQAQKSANGGAAEHRIAAHHHAPVADALAASLNRSPRSQSLVQLRAALDESPRVQALQGLGRALNRTRVPEGEEAEQPAQDARPAVAQFAAMPDDAGKPHDPPPAPPVQKKPNATGLPDRLKAGVEQLSGLALDDVRVHYNSSKPAAVQAHAYAQGTDIHLAPGQEKHLPHEAWHVVQQKQGRVKPTLQMKGVVINDDAGLEREAEGMGTKALRRPDDERQGRSAQAIRQKDSDDLARNTLSRWTVMQRFWFDRPDGEKGIEWQEEEKKDLETMMETAAQHGPENGHPKGTVWRLMTATEAIKAKLAAKKAAKTTKTKKKEPTSQEVLDLNFAGGAWQAARQKLDACGLLASDQINFLAKGGTDAETIADEIIAATADAAGRIAGLKSFAAGISRAVAARVAAEHATMKTWNRTTIATASLAALITEGVIIVAVTCFDYGNVPNGESVYFFWIAGTGECLTPEWHVHWAAGNRVEVSSFKNGAMAKDHTWTNQSDVDLMRPALGNKWGPGKK